jgi:hypothetical protein
MGNLKRLSVFVFKLCLLFFFTALALEASLRLYNRINPTCILPGVSYNRFRGRPFAKDYDFYLNSRGFKGKEFNPEKKLGVFRIVAIGDSVCFGVVPYKYLFLTLLEQKLNREAERVEIINMGIPCIGVRNYLKVLLNEGLETNPDAVMCFFFIGNDFLDEIQRNNRPFLYSLLKYIFSIAFKTRVSGPSQYDDNAATFSKKDYLKIEKLRSQVFLRRNPGFTYQLSQVVSNIKNMSDVCAAKKIKFLLFLIPDELQIDPGLQSEVIASFRNLGREAFDFTLPNNRLSLALRMQGVECMDLLVGFAQVVKRERLYKLRDTHWNISGNAIAADLIFKRLKEEWRDIP